MSLSSKKERINYLLQNLDYINGIIGTGVVEKNGLLVTSHLPVDVDKRELAAMTATMFGAMETAVSSLQESKVHNLMVDFDSFKLIVISNGNYILTCLVEKDVNLGLIMIEMEEIVRKLKDFE
ncbi:MAG: hypothetical protein GF383_06970 [Candidatus Lokiarchaeota archaeon]|nr:hypothetical protein [Candidatus Lokiarchaeota archaeon]MBD3339891.1 hypothetical protein [Candidatus Lokiarchaeota archaeon]